MACASLHSRVSEQIHEGQSQDEVRAILGSPSDLKQNGNSLSWVYTKRREACEIVFKDNQVVATDCISTGPSDAALAIQALAVGLQSMGQGMIQGAQRNRETETELLQRSPAAESKHHGGSDLLFYTPPQPIYTPPLERPSALPLYTPPPSITCITTGGITLCN